MKNKILRRIALTSFALLSGALVLSCQGGGGLGVNFVGQMALDDASLQFECVYKKTADFDTEIVVVKKGQAQATFKLFYGTSGDEWLKLRATSADFIPGATQIGIPVTILCSTLDIGNYEATIKAVSNDKTVPDVNGTVKVRVIPDIARLAVQPAQLDFSCTQGGADPAAQPLQAINSGLPATELNVAFLPQDTWVSAAPASASGIQSGSSASTSIAVSCAGLTPGTYTSSVQTTGTDNYKGSAATDSPATTPITLTVREPMPSIGLSKTALSLECVNGLASQTKNSDTVRVQNKGIGQLSWQAQDFAGWLSVSPSSGSGLGPNQYNVPDMTVTAVCGSSGIAASGTYTTAIHVVSPKADNSPQTINVTLKVRDKQAGISIDTSRLDLYCYQGTQTSDSKTKSLSNNGDPSTTLSWSASDNGSDAVGTAPNVVNWLTISPASGSLALDAGGAGTPQTLTFSADCSSPNFPWPSGTSPTSDDATVTISGTTQENGTAAKNSPTTFTVRLNINSNRPSITLNLTPKPRELYLEYGDSTKCVNESTPAAYPNGPTGTATLTITNNGAEHSKLYWKFKDGTYQNSAWWTATNPLQYVNPQGVSKGNSENSTLTYDCRQIAVGSRNYDYAPSGDPFDVCDTSFPTACSSETAQIVLKRAYPVIKLSPTTLNFACDYAHRSPSGQTLNISNDSANAIDTSRLKWSASDNQSWLSLSPTSNSTGLGKGAAADPVTVSVDCTGFVANASGTITVTDTSAAGNTSLARPSSTTAGVNVDYKVSRLSLNPTSLTLRCDSTKTPVSGTVTVSNNGEDPSWIFWTASSNRGWITASPAAGPNNGQRTSDVSTGKGGLRNGAAGNSVTITVDCANSDIYNPNPSGYTGTVTFSGEDPDGHAENSVTLNITAPVDQ